jgi:hypothetical protein
VVGHGRRHYLQPILQFADAHSGLARADEGTIDLQRGRIPQRLQMRRGVAELHGVLMTVSVSVADAHSRIFEIQARFVDTPILGQAPPALTSELGIPVAFDLSNERRRKGNVA